MPRCRDLSGNFSDDNRQHKTNCSRFKVQGSLIVGPLQHEAGNRVQQTQRITKINTYIHHKKNNNNVQSVSMGTGRIILDDRALTLAQCSVVD